MIYWIIGIPTFIGIGIAFWASNKFNLIPLFLVGFILTPLSNNLFYYLMSFRCPLFLYLLKLLNLFKTLYRPIEAKKCTISAPKRNHL